MGMNSIPKNRTCLRIADFLLPATVLCYTTGYSVPKNSMRNNRNCLRTAFFCDGGQLLRAREQVTRFTVFCCLFRSFLLPSAVNAVHVPSSALCRVRWNEER